MREGYSSKRVNPSWRADDSLGLKPNFLRQGITATRDNLMGGYTQGSGNIRKLTRVGGVTLRGVSTRQNVYPPARVTLAHR